MGDSLTLYLDINSSTGTALLFQFDIGFCLGFWIDIWLWTLEMIAVIWI
jgi:hypothetical protein